MRGHLETARTPEAGGERQRDPELARTVRHPMDLFRRPGRGARGSEAVDPEELPAARIEQGQDDISRLLAGNGMEIVARPGGDPQDRRPVADGCGILAASAAEAREQEH
jgi:hypothetical protein